MEDNQNQIVENSQDNVVERNPDKILGIPTSIAKIAGGVLIVLVVLALVSSPDCALSVNCTTEKSLLPPTFGVGVIAAIALMTFLQTPVLPAVAAGVGVWVLLESFHSF